MKKEKQKIIWNQHVLQNQIDQIVIDNPKCQNLLNLPDRVDPKNTSLEPPKSICVSGLLENPKIAFSRS